MMAVVWADVKKGAGAGLAPPSVRSRKPTLAVRILHVSAYWRMAEIVSSTFSMVLGASFPIKSVANCWSVGTSRSCGAESLNFGRMWILRWLSIALTVAGESAGAIALRQAFTAAKNVWPWI